MKKKKEIKVVLELTETASSEWTSLLLQINEKLNKEQLGKAV